MSCRFVWLVSLFALPSSLLAVDLSNGIAAFDDRRWLEAMGEFLKALHEDPANAQAQSYVALTARQLDAEKRQGRREKRLEILASATEHLEAGRRDASSLSQAYQETATAEQRAREERWRLLCEEARMKRDSGQLLAANDLVLQVLEENPAFSEAQRELSELQSQLRDALEGGSSLSITDRYAAQGFYDYGQADYEGALTAWRKLHALADAGTIKTLRTERYEKKARAEVDRQRREQALQRLFEQGLAHYQKDKFLEALDLFRQVAIQDPEYPGLGPYLVKAEAGAERDRARRLGEQKRLALAQQLERGTAALMQEKYPDAIDAFEQALRLDPSHAQARSYLSLARSEEARRLDPRAAQQRYESGLVAYASGRLEEAAREWRLALRLDPRHEKARMALSKVQKELAMETNTHASLP